MVGIPFLRLARQPHDGGRASRQDDMAILAAVPRCYHDSVHFTVA
jgi:hypothetical protein